MKTYHTTIPSPIGAITLTASDRGITGLYMENHKGYPVITADWDQDVAPFRDLHRQLDAYFAGKLQKFDVPLDLKGTPFQLEVWRALMDIPYGETATYLQQAIRISRPAAIRAVGTANGRNPISIIVPCHRVIGTNGSLTGYGGGLDRKRYLLELEKKGN